MSLILHELEADGVELTDEQAFIWLEATDILERYAYGKGEK